MARRAHPPSLPEEILVHEILRRLPLKLVVRFRCICKLWNFLLSEPAFIQSQLNCSISQNPNDDYLIFKTSKIGVINVKSQMPSCISILSRSNLSEICIDNVPYPRSSGYAISLLGSINGLVCIVCLTSIDSYLDHYYFILWNPAMNISKKILLPKDCPPRYLFGFGWDSVANNYKLIVQSRDSLQAVVYSCETDSWSNIVDSKFSQHIHEYDMCWIPSVIVNGICYWNCFKTFSQVLKFEARNNEFTYLTVPCVRERYKLVNLNDCLARIEYAAVGEDIMDVYIFNEERNIWSKIYTTNLVINGFKSITSCFKIGGMMIVFNKDQNKFYFFDPKLNVIKSLPCWSDKQDKKYIPYFGRGFSYTPSLVFLEGMKSFHP